MAWAWVEKIKLEYQLQRNLKKTADLIRGQIDKEKAIASDIEKLKLPNSEKEIRKYQGYSKNRIDENFAGRHMNLTHRADEIKNRLVQLNNGNDISTRGKGIGGFFGRLFSGRAFESQRRNMESDNLLRQYNGNKNDGRLYDLIKERDDSVDSSIRPTSMDKDTLERAHYIYNDPTTSEWTKNMLESHELYYNKVERLKSPGSKLPYIDTTKVVFSPALKRAIDQRREKRAEVTDIVENYLQVNPLPEEYGRFDNRDASDMFMYPESMTDKAEIKEYVETRIRALTSINTADRKWVLDEFYNKLDNFDINTMNMDVLTGKEKPSNNGELTTAEKDMLSMIDRMRIDQSLQTKEFENSEYIEGRYSTLRDKAEYNQSNEYLMLVCALVVNALANNDYRNGLEKKEGLSEVGISELDAVHNFQLQVNYQSYRAAKGVKDDLTSIKLQPRNNSYGRGGLESIVNKDYNQLSESEKKASGKAFNDLIGSSFDSIGVRKSLEIGKSIYIDGKSAYDRFADQMIGLEPHENIAKTRVLIMQSILSGKHNVEVAKHYVDENGRDKANIMPIEFDYSKLEQTKAVKECSKSQRKILSNRAEAQESHKKIGDEYVRHFLRKAEEVEMPRQGIEVAEQAKETVNKKTVSLESLAPEMEKKSQIRSASVANPTSMSKEKLAGPQK